MGSDTLHLGGMIFNNRFQPINDIHVYLKIRASPSLNGYPINILRFYCLICTYEDIFCAFVMQLPRVG